VSSEAFASAVGLGCRLKSLLVHQERSGERGSLG
jgi:hypothetical protein